jgi:hypothetical protein
MRLKRWTTFDNRGFEPKSYNSSPDLQRIREYSNLGQRFSRMFSYVLVACHPNEPGFVVDIFTNCLKWRFVPKMG